MNKKYFNRTELGITHTSVEHETRKAKQIIDELSLAIICKDAKRIKAIYENSVDWEMVENDTFEVYHKLIDEGNDIIMQ